MTAKRISNERQQLTVYLPSDVVENARNAVIATTPYTKGYQSLSALVADAIEEKLLRLEKQFNSGQSFPPRKVELRRGRPST